MIRKQIWTLYCHTHIATGRRYIGLTQQTMEKRWQKHVYAAFRFSKGGRWHFPNAIRKYGPDAFSHEILAQSWILESANAAEEELILQYDTRNPEKGFNLAKGGGSQPHLLRKNPWDDPEYRARCTKAAQITFSRPDVRVKSAVAKRAPDYVIKKAIINREILSRPLVREKTSKAFAGKNHTFETKRRISSSPTRYRQVGPVSQEVKLKIASSVKETAQRKYDSDDQVEPKTKVCPKHGELSINSFYKYRVDYGCGSRFRYCCKQCQIDRSSERWTSRRVS